MIIVNTKNRNMPHPLHNFKLNGKMKNFTTTFTQYGVKGVLTFSLFILTFFSMNETHAQTTTCNFASPNQVININSNSSSNGFEPLSYTALTGNLNQTCTTTPGPVTENKLFWRDPGSMGGIMEIIESPPAPVGNQVSVIYVACQNPNSTFQKDTFLSGQTIIFYSAVNEMDIINNNTSEFDSVEVTINVIDVTPPTYTPPVADTTINCLADTSSYSMNLGPTNVQDPCSGVRDTIIQQVITNSGLTGDTCLKITRTWTFVDNSDVATIPFVQNIAIIDTIGPFWDTAAINRLLVNDPFNYQEGPSFLETDTTLNVFVDTSLTTARYDFFKNTFRPVAVDSCFGDTTLIPESNVSILYDSIRPVGLTISNTECFDTLLLIFDAVDSKGYHTGSGTGVGKFYLNIIVKDTTPPVVIEEPLAGFTPLSTGLMDTFLVYVDSGMCSKTFLADEIDIKVRDAISLDTVAYRWRIDSIGTTIDSIAGSTNTAPLFTAIDTTITRPFGIGDFKVTYFYQDSTCANIDSFQFFLKIRTWEPIVTSRITATTGITEVRTGIGSLDTRVDTIITFNEAGMCGINLDSAAVRIIAQDTFEHDTIIYRWRVRTLSGTTIRQDGTMADSLSAPNTLPIEQTFRDSNNAAALFYPVGIHELTYFFRDTSQRGCFNVDSIKYIINVRDTSGNDIAYAPFGTAVVLMNDQFVLTTHADLGECTDQLNFDEPVPTDFTNCGITTGSANTTIERKLVSSPNSNIFSSIFGSPNGGSIDREFPIGETIFRYIFTDSIGSTDSITFNITVLDTIPPVVNCPISVLINRDPVTCIGIAADYSDFITNNCTPNAVLPITQTPGIGDTVMDGQTITLFLDGVIACTFTAELTDLAPMPVLPLAQDTTIYCSIIELPAPRATICGQTDTIFALPRNRGQINISTATLRTYIFDSRETTIVWEFFDSSTPEVTRVVQEITFLADTIAPVAVCYDSVTVYPDTFGSVIILPSALDSLGLSRDNCTAKTDLKMSVSMDTLVNCDSIGKFFEVFLYLEDEAGNRDTCSSIVTVKDTLAPLFSNIPANDTLTCTDAIPAVIQPDIIDNCTGIDTMFMAEVTTRLDTSSTVDLETLQRSFDYFNYEITRTFFAVDKSGNIDSVKQVITVRDITPPAITFDTILFVPTSEDATTCSGNITLDLLGNINDQCSDTLKYLAVADQDTIIRHDTLEMIFLNIPMGDTTIFIIAEDFSNNRDTQKIEIRVDDRTEPVPRCNNSVAVTINAFGFAAIDSSVINLNSIDNCTPADELRFELSQDTFRCEDIGQTITIFMNVIDKFGNSAPCQSNVTVNDFAGTGSFACPADVTIACDAATEPDSTGFPSLMAVCGGGSRLDKSDNIVAGPGGTGNICQIIERTWTFTDSVSGTVTTCLQLINLVDDTAPVLTETFNDTIVACILTADTRDSILATDNCVADAYVHAVDSFTMGTDTITLRRIWTAFDSCRITADTQYIRIVDDLAPTISLPADTVYNTADFSPDTCGVFVNIDFTPYVTDCNASLGLRIGYQVQDSLAQDTTAILSQYFPIGKYDVIVTARDSSNNIGTDTITIDVQDTSIPSVFCVENIVVSLGTGGTGILQVSDVLIRATDNCGGNLPDSLASLSQTSFDCSDLGLQEVVLSVMDTSGNIGTCTVNVNVINQGNTDIISVATVGQDESVAGFNDGVAWVEVTGGSGNYTYLWTPGGATTDTIRDLAPGVYTVEVNDATSNCRLTDTVAILAGGTVTYHIGDVSGMPGTIVQVPITVTNFTNVTSIDMSINLSNLAVAQFVPGNEADGFNVPGINLTSFNIDPDNANRLLVGANLDVQMGETVTDGTAIFYVNVQLLANTMIGDTTNLIGDGNSEATIKTGVLINGSPVDIVAQSTNGKVTVSIINNNDLAVGGKINLINGNPLVNTTVILSGAISRIDSSGTDGVYNFTVSSGQNITVTPTENENARNGLSTFDLVLIQDHINGRLLDTPYKRLAADIDKSGSVSIFDIIEIQDVILRRKAAFTAIPSWVFVPAAHTFENPANPWAGTVPTSITTTASAADTALNFVAIKSGDVSLDADEVRFQGNAIAEDRNKDFAFKVTNQVVEAGTYIEIPFKADNFNQIRGYQMTVDVATDWLTFESVKAGALTDVSDGNFGLSNSARGQIATNWFSNTARTVEDGATLFTLVFKVEKTGSQLSDLIQITSDMIHAEAYTDDLFYNGIDLVFEDNPAILEAFELFQNQPNPFRTETNIGFNLPEKAPVLLRFFDFSGRMTHQVKGDYPKGKNFVTINKNDLSANGVLYYELSTPGFTGRKKMIVLE